VPSALVTGSLAYFGEHSAALLTIAFVFISATMFAVCLGIVGYWREKEFTSAPIRRSPPARAPQAQSQPDMRIREAFDHLAAGGRWADIISAPIWTEIRQAARDGRLLVWGRPESAHLNRPYKPVELIPPEHWRDYGFDHLRCYMGEEDYPARTEPDDDRQHPLNKGYADLWVNRTQVADLWPKPQAEGLRIEIGNGPPFDFYTSRLHTQTHLIRVGITNGITDRAVTNCEFILEEINDPSIRHCPALIKQNFIINGGATDYIPIADFDERIDTTRPAPNKPGQIRLHFPFIRKLSDGYSYLPAGSYKLTLKATSAETAPAIVKCCLSRWRMVYCPCIVSS